MNDRKLIKKIFNLAHYDFSNNFTNWFSIAGLHAIIISIIFCCLCFVTSDYSVTSWGWSPHLLFDWTNKFYSLIVDDVPNWMFAITNIAVVASLIVLPLIVIQNALDLAFDSSMSGYSCNMIAFSYAGAMLFCNTMLLLFMQIMSCIGVFIGLYFMQANFAIDAFIVKISMLIMSFFVLYCMQLTYFLSMHILEYKKGMWQSYKDLVRMVHRKVLFLCKILFLQLCTIGCVLAFLYLCLGPVIIVIMPMILWFFSALHLVVEPIFIVMMFNFFYVWAYVLLYAWICLVLAHVYRQLMCPPVENASCLSCTSCEK